MKGGGKAGNSVAVRAALLKLIKSAPKSPEACAKQNITIDEINRNIGMVKLAERAQLPEQLTREGWETVELQARYTLLEHIAQQAGQGGQMTEHLVALFAVAKKAGVPGPALADARAKLARQGSAAHVSAQKSDHQAGDVSGGSGTASEVDDSELGQLSRENEALQAKLAELQRRLTACRSMEDEGSQEEDEKEEGHEEHCDEQGEVEPVEEEEHHGCGDADQDDMGVELAGAPGERVVSASKWKKLKTATRVTSAMQPAAKASKTAKQAEGVSGEEVAAGEVAEEESAVGEVSESARPEEPAVACSEGADAPGDEEKVMPAPDEQASAGDVPSGDSEHVVEEERSPPAESCEPAQEPCSEQQPETAKLPETAPVSSAEQALNDLLEDGDAKCRPAQQMLDIIRAARVAGVDKAKIAKARKVLEKPIQLSETREICKAAVKAAEAARPSGKGCSRALDQLTLAIQRSAKVGFMEDSLTKSKKLRDSLTNEERERKQLNMLLKGHGTTAAELNAWLLSVKSKKERNIYQGEWVDAACSAAMSAIEKYSRWKPNHALILQGLQDGVLLYKSPCEQSKK